MTRRPVMTVLLACSMFAVVALVRETQPPGQPQPPKQKQGSEPRQSPAAAKPSSTPSRISPVTAPREKGVLPGTDLTSGKWKHGSTLAAIAKTISEGVPGTAMVPAKDRFSKAEILELAKLVQSFDKTRARKKPSVKK